MSVFTPLAGFVEASGLGYNRVGLNRMNGRYRVLIEPIAGRFAGKNVLDLASHDGRWSYACLRNGAAHVTGIEVRRDTIEKSRYIITPEMRSRVRFIHGNIFDVLPDLIREGARFDIVLCLGIFYHIMDHYRLLTLMTEFRPELIVMDTGLVDSDLPMIELTTEPAASLLNGAPEPRSAQTMVGNVSRRGIEMMANNLGYTVRYLQWTRENTPDPAGLGDYFFTNKEGRRRYSFLLEPVA